ncbi:hypothetical protein SK128_027621, partial [Halocaridina rubra]
MYSLPLGGGADGGEEALGVMVIKCKDKTKAKQRKGALSNWKRVGRVTIDALHRRGVTGEYLRREMWGLQTAASTPVKGPSKKKGGYDLLGNPTGPDTGDIMGDAFNQALFAGDADPMNEHDGIGALTGAIDQLAFTCDLDFSGDGVDDDPIKTINMSKSSEAGQKQPLLQEKKKKKRRNSDGFDNPAFLDDEELLLAAALGGNGAESEEDDADMLESRRLAQPRIVIQAETDTASDPLKLITKPPAAKDPKLAAKTAVPDVNTLSKPRLPSAKMRRIGSARKTPARFTMTFEVRPEGQSGYTAPDDDDPDSGDRWAERKPRRKNQVAPSSSSESNEEIRTKDDLAVGLQSGTDNSREELMAKEKKERPKTSVASEKMKKRATDEVGNMNSILPWDNEDGDI